MASRKPKLPPIGKGTTKPPRAPRDYAHGYRYELRKPNQEARDFRRFVSFTQAITAMRAEVQEFRKGFARLGIQDAVEACDVVLTRISWLDGDGGKVVGVVDPYTGAKYRAELVRLLPS